MERTRSVEYRVTIDTNKRTIDETFTDADALVERLHEWADEGIISPLVESEETSVRIADADGVMQESTTQAGANWFTGALPDGSLAPALTPEEKVRAMAYVNALLPADSPYKITREDVDIIRSVAMTFSPQMTDGRVYRLLALAAKLAALLPPE
jgi:hypothetical protein